MLQAVTWLSILLARSLRPVTFSDLCSDPRGKQMRGTLCVAHGIVSGCASLTSLLHPLLVQAGVPPTRKPNTNPNPRREDGQCLGADGHPV